MIKFTKIIQVRSVVVRVNVDSDFVNFISEGDSDDSSDYENVPSTTVNHYTERILPREKPKGL